MAPISSTVRRNGNILREVPVDTDYDRACRDRFLGIWRTLIGEKISVRLIDGSVHEGIYFTSNPFPGEKFQIVLRMSNNKDRATLCIPVEDIIHLQSLSYPISQFQNTKNFATDSDISRKNRLGKERVLQKVDSAWIPSVVDHDESPELNDTFHFYTDSNVDTEKWDQFETNRLITGKSSSFDENLYTTELDRSKVTPAMQREAERIASEIEGGNSSNSHIRQERNQLCESDYEHHEEIMFSGVVDPYVTAVENETRSSIETSRTDAVKEALQKVLNLDSLNEMSNAECAAHHGTIEIDASTNKTWAAVTKSAASTSECDATASLDFQQVQKSEAVSGISLPPGVVAHNSVEQKLMDSSINSVSKESKFKFNPNAKVFKPISSSSNMAASTQNQTASISSPCNSETRSTVMENGMAFMSNEGTAMNVPAVHPMLQNDVMALPSHPMPITGFQQQPPIFYGSNPMMPGVAMAMENSMLHETMPGHPMVAPMIPMGFPAPHMYPFPANPYINFAYSQHPHIYPHQMMHPSNLMVGSNMYNQHGNNHRQQHFGLNGRSRSNSLQSQRSGAFNVEETAGRSPNVKASTDNGINAHSGETAEHHHSESGESKNAVTASKGKNRRTSHRTSKFT